VTRILKCSPKALSTLTLGTLATLGGAYVKFIQNFKRNRKSIRGKEKMKETRIEFRLTCKEKRELEKLSKKYDSTLAQYIRRKLFRENAEYEELSERYISPEADKNNLLNITVNYKISYMLSKLFIRLGLSVDEFNDIQQEALDYARNERLKYGYRIIKS
jgi:hypothetical protein